VTGPCEDGNKLLDYINGKKCLDQMSDYQVLKKGSLFHKVN
jgi:hypothetical protein